MNPDFQKNYRVIVEKIFNNWQNLRLAIEHGMGGKNGQKVAIDIMNYTYEYCIGNDITQGELEEVIEELMDQELNTVSEDGSVSEICRQLVRYKQMSLQGRYAEIQLELNKLPQGKDWLIPDVAVSPISSYSSSEDISDSLDETADTLMETDVEQPSGPPSSQQIDNFVEPEDGWTTVRNRKK